MHGMDDTNPVALRLGLHDVDVRAAKVDTDQPLAAEKG